MNDAVSSAKELSETGDVFERLSVFLDMKREEIDAQISTLDGIQSLVQSLQSKQHEIYEIDPNFDVTDLQAALDAAKHMVNAKKEYVQDINSPEKKGIFRRAFDRVKGFAVNHPVVTTLLVAALVAGGIAAGLYFTGNMELVLAKVGLGKILGGAEAAGELIPPTPPTPPLPGGGMFEVPGGTPPVPGSGGLT